MQFHDYRLVCRHVLVELLHYEPVRPHLLVQVEEHLLLQVVLAVVDPDGVVVTIETMDERLNGWFVQVTQVGGSLARFVPKHHRLRVNQPERVDHHLALHTLDGIDNNGHCSLVERLEALLRVYVDTGEPTPEAWMAVIPPYNHLGPPGLLEHVQHLGLEDRIDCLNANTGSALGHREDVRDSDGVVVNKLPQHQPHHLHRYTSTTVLEHLQEREGGDVNLLGSVHHRGVRRRGRPARSPNRRQVTLQAIHDSSLRSNTHYPIVYDLLSSRKHTRALPLNRWGFGAADRFGVRNRA
mmetsp:Transcript_40664/g.68091  ORF Transcript_40664/g.68091 Transcript_40664/m.68091 type:complete len:296 (-) Transcript_40664:132-1019(-)